jgi:predicted nucleic acid-binding protein
MAMNWSGGPWVADTSAWARADVPTVRKRWVGAAKGGDLVACPIVTLELLYGARDAEAVETVASACSAMRQAPITRSVTDAAVMAIRELAARGSAGSHRVRVPDALIGAAAAQLGFGVLHYDRHFDRLADVLGFRSQWVAPQGAID